MKSITYTLAVVLTLIDVALASSHHLPSFYTKNKHITELSPKNFDDVVLKSNYTTAVEFYAPWCQYCQKFRKDFVKASKVASDFVQFAAVDCNKDSNKQICSEYQIEGFPTVMMFRSPKFPTAGSQVSKEVYREERSTRALVETLKGRVKNYAKRITVQKLPKFVDISNSAHNRTLLLTDKSTLSPAFKGLSVDFSTSLQLGYMNVGKDNYRQAAVEGIPELDKDFTAPALVAFSKEEGTVVYEGSLKSKLEISKFLSRFGQAVDGPASERGEILKGLRENKYKSFRQYYKQKKSSVPPRDEL